MNAKQIETTIPEQLTIDPRALDIIDLPGLATKHDVAKFFGVTTRHIDAEITAGRFPFPLYVGRRSPRWRRSTILNWLESQSQLSEDA